MAETQKEEHINGGGNMTRDDHLERIRTAGSITISPELFEQLYLSPQNQVKGELRRTFANPTPVAIGGFLLCTTPLSMVLLGWRGAGGLGAANVGTYFYFGGLCLILGGVGEFLLGNSFPTVVFILFGAFWFTFGATLVPSYAAYASYSSDPVTMPGEGLTSPVFFATFSFFLVSMALLCFVFMIASLRTNIIFFTIFLLLIPTFSLLAAAFFKLSEGDAVHSLKYQHAGAGLLLAISFLGWYLFTVLVFAGVDFPVNLPVGDLSTIIKGGSDLAARKKEREGEL